MMSMRGRTLHVRPRSHRVTLARLEYEYQRF